MLWFEIFTLPLNGIIVDRSGPVSYTVKVPNGNVIRKHIDHLREYLSRQPELPTSVEEQVSEPSEFVDRPPNNSEADAETQPHSYPQKARQPPQRLMNFSTYKGRKCGVLTL